MTSSPGSASWAIAAVAAEPDANANPCRPPRVPRRRARAARGSGSASGRIHSRRAAYRRRPARRSMSGISAERRRRSAHPAQRGGRQRLERQVGMVVITRHGAMMAPLRVRVLGRARLVLGDQSSRSKTSSSPSWSSIWRRPWTRPNRERPATRRCPARSTHGTADAVLPPRPFRRVAPTTSVATPWRRNSNSIR